MLKLVSSEGRTQRTFLIVILIALVAIILIGGTGLWSLLSASAHKPGNTTLTNTLNAADKPSPLLFGTNLNLLNNQDQFLQSTTTRALLQQMHMRIVRIPLHTNTSIDTQLTAAHSVKSLGMIPLVVLHGPSDPHAQRIDTTIVRAMNTIYGNDTVYYEFGEEQDLLGISAGNYVASWNKIVGSLQKLAPQGKFVGPVNYHFDPTYLTTFLQAANPQPDAISWHEFTCSATDTKTACLANIQQWSQHITTANHLIQATAGHAIPIMITEWNYAANASATDGKSSDKQFLTSWTTRAMQTLAASHIFAAMQYSCTGTASPLIDSSNQPTAQGTRLQYLYERAGMLKQEQMLPAPNPEKQQLHTGRPQYFYSFEDGKTDQWYVQGNKYTTIKNSTNVKGYQGKRTLAIHFSGLHDSDYPFTAVNLPAKSNVKAGQLLKAYVYLPQGSPDISAKIFVTDTANHWYNLWLNYLVPGQWKLIDFVVPSNIVKRVNTIGVQFHIETAHATQGTAYIDAVGVYPKSSIATSASSATYSFEDNHANDDWHIHGDGITNVTVSTAEARDGSHSLAVNWGNTHNNVYPFISTFSDMLSPAPHSGQVLAAYIYIPKSATGKVQAALFVKDGKYHWHGSPETPALTPGKWNRIDYIIPTHINEPVVEFGLQFFIDAPTAAQGTIYIDTLGWY